MRLWQWLSAELSHLSFLEEYTLCIHYQENVCPEMELGTSGLQTEVLPVPITPCLMLRWDSVLKSKCQLFQRGLVLRGFFWHYPELEAKALLKLPLIRLEELN